MDFAKAGIDALLTPEESVLLLIDHQAFQFANLNSHDPTIIVNNVIGLAKVVKVFGVPVVLTTVTGERGGHIIKGPQDVFPDNKPIDRTLINTVPCHAGYPGARRRLSGLRGNGCVWRRVA
jgi:nicotinamidase-related amidase